MKDCGLWKPLLLSEGAQQWISPASPWTCIIRGVIVWPKLSAWQWFILPWHRYILWPLCPLGVTENVRFFEYRLISGINTVRILKEELRIHFFSPSQSVFCLCGMMLFTGIYWELKRLDQLFRCCNSERWIAVQRETKMCCEKLKPKEHVTSNVSSPG